MTEEVSFQCRFCTDRFGLKKTCADHQKNCSHNPDTTLSQHVFEIEQRSQMKKVILYECDHCHFQFGNKKLCIDHESSCFDNPKNRTCTTCKFHGRDLCYNTCEKKLITFTMTDNFKMNCEGWEQKD